MVETTVGIEVTTSPPTGSTPATAKHYQLPFQQQLYPMINIRFGEFRGAVVASSSLQMNYPGIITAEPQLFARFLK
jgi:hypothetical protein